MTLYRFSDLPKPVDLAIPAEMMQVLADLMPGWDVAPSAGKTATGDAQDPVLRFEFSDRKYSITGPWVPDMVSRADPVDAACGFIAELIRAYVNEAGERLCLHAAGAEIGGRMVIFPSTHKAGKSVLSAALAAAGCRLSGDDIVLIDAENRLGVSGGLCPRLRLPLPDNLLPETTAFIAANTGPTGKRYRYLTLDETRLARKEESMPIGTFVLLQREEDGAARLEEIERTEALRTVIWQNFARREPSTLILERLYALVGQTGAFRMTYSRAEDAVALLQRRFANWPDGFSSAPKLPPATLVTTTADSNDTGLPVFRRKANVAAIEIDGQIFLADNESGRITLLNETASAVWHALGQSMAKSEIVELMCMAFPQIETATIANDVQMSLDSLAASGLVVAPDRQT